MKHRVLQLDYLKGFFILLMVVFHLQLINHTYPILCKAVYTFHMPAFLIISGYLANVQKDIRTFGNGILRLAIPYIVFEALYILMIFFMGKVLGSSNQMENLDLWEFLSNIILSPLGTYWYIHTLIICSTTYYLMHKLCKKEEFAGLVLTGVALYGISNVISSLEWYNVIYFLIGLCIQRSNRSFIDTVPPSLIVIFPLILLFSSSDNFYRGSMAGIAITVFVISFLLYMYNHISSRLRKLLCYLGKNSLAIVIFSPAFTILTKIVEPYFNFDPTAIFFLLFAPSFVISGCLFTAWLIDKLNISRYIFLKDKLYVNY